MLDQLEEKRKVKYIERGGFKDMIFLDYVE